MTIANHQNAVTRFIEVDGNRIAYRRFGSGGEVPLVFFMHFTGTMDYWDPAVTDGLSTGREVILFDNVGVSSSTGTVPTTMRGMALDAAKFLRALGLAQVDALGFSIGGFVAQEFAIQEPELCRRLVLVGTGPRGGEGMASLSPEAQSIFAETYEEPDDVWLKIMFSPSERSQSAGRSFIERFRARSQDRDPETSKDAVDRQLQAINEWGVPHPDRFEYLKQVTQPTLVINGDNDVVVYTSNSFTLQKHIPDAQLVIYPDANHGALYQYPERFVGHVSLFLEEQGGPN